MPITYRYDAAEDLVRVESVGVVTADDIRGYYASLAGEAWIRPGMRFLADDRGLTTVPPTTEFAAAANSVERSASFLRGARIAVLVADVYAYGTTRQFAMLSADTGAEIVPFYARDEALRWLGP